jgi:hypothetical protein
MKVVLNEEVKWPKEINLIDIPPLNRVLDIFNELKQEMYIPIDGAVTPSTENLTATPHYFIPALSFILRSIEDQRAECNDEYKMPRRFTLLPFPSLKWKYISISEKALASNTKQTMPYTYEDKLKLFDNVLDFRKFGFER